MTRLVSRPLPLSMENVDEWKEIFFLSLYGNYTQIQIYEFIHLRFPKHLQKYFSCN